MKQSIDIAQEIEGRFQDVVPVLRLDLDEIVGIPLEEMRVRVGAGSLTHTVTAEVGAPEIGGRTAGVEVGTVAIPVSWRSTAHASLFPKMRAELRIRDRGHETIEVRLLGEYEAPLGLLGIIGDRVLGHRAAADSLDDYVERVASRLARHLAAHRPPRRPPPSPSRTAQPSP
jgi:hypothetical protein